jgi:hypothetical protein
MTGKPGKGASAAMAESPEFFIKKPLGYSYFPKELVPTPKDWVATTGNLVFHREHEKVRLPQNFCN